MIPGSSSRVPSKLEEGSTCSPGHTHHIYHALAGASTTPGYALRMGEERKMIAHAGVCRAADLTFIPLVVESLGGWTEEVIQTIKSIGRLQGQRLGIPPPDTMRHLFQRLAISLWKGNASLWVRRQPACSATVDGIV